MQDMTYSRVFKVLVQTAGISSEALEASTDLQSLGLDSLAMLEVGLALAKEYGVEFDDGSIAQARTVEELVELVRQTTAAVTG
jgi:acyl carrier protein